MRRRHGVCVVFLATAAVLTACLLTEGPRPAHAFVLRPPMALFPSSPLQRVPQKEQELATRRFATTSNPAPPPAAAAATAAAPAGPEKAKARVILKGLQADRFRHPLDQQVTEQLRMIPGLEWVVRRVMTVLEEAVYLDNISSAILVGPTQMPSLHASLVEAASILDLPLLPELYIKQSPVPNAYCMAIQGRRPFIVMHTSLIDLLTPAEIQVVLAHELTHIKCEHGVFITAANALAMGLYSVGGSLGRILGDRLSNMLFAWLRAAELSCDRGALLVAQDLDVVLSALLKLVGGSQSLNGQLSTEAFLQQARSYDQAGGRGLGRFLRQQLEVGLTHPLPVLRVRELERWYNSEMYGGIVGRGVLMKEEEGGKEDEMEKEAVVGV
ncbi:peptidase [Nannochloropsis oceanica]